MFRVSIVIPSWHYYYDPTLLQPVHELHYATVITSRFPEIDFDIIDLRGISSEQQICHINERDLYLYWIVRTGDSSRIALLIKNIRKYYPEAKHVAGGTHIDIFGEECLQDYDAIVKGPGEESFIKVIKDVRSGKIERIYSSDYKDVHYGSYPFMKRDFLPRPAIVNTKKFKQHGENIKGTDVLFSRGCNFKCNFCVNNIPNNQQMKPPEIVREELQYLKTEYDIGAVNLKDEVAIPVNDELAFNLLGVLKDADMMWRGQTTVRGVSEEKIKMARESGCVELAVGVESVSEKVLSIINKGINIEQVKSFIRLCKKYGIKVKTDIVFGLPGEPFSIVDDTINFIEETQPEFVNIHGLDPTPGSHIYNNSKYYGIKSIETENWDNHSAYLVFRYSDEEAVGLPFEYEPVNRWGKTFTNEEIISNIKYVQRYLRERKMIY
jgi:radical SAM superfamily enzyme YgiQ (UPF0313 family)